MLLTITYTRFPATDLGYLLHKNPARPQTFDLAYGKAHVFYPEANEHRCTAVLLLDIDPVELARGKRGSNGQSLFDYVNDRPYVASSFLSVAIARIFTSALAGRSKNRPELAEEELPFEAGITMLPSRGGEDIIKRLFEPLGYEVHIESYLLNETFPEWGDGNYYNVVLKKNCRLQDLLSHLYVLIPVLDRDKHYWVGKDEVEKLLRHGEGWLANHPEKELITSRYLIRQRKLINQALGKLLEEDMSDPEDRIEKIDNADEMEQNLNLNQQRLGTVMAVLKSFGATKVIDLGCGEGKLLALLLKDKSFTDIAGTDVSIRALERASARLKLEKLSDSKRERNKLFQSSLTYRDKRFSGYEAATIIEVIEHLDINRLNALKRVVFEYTRPATVIVTTPNAEYNIIYESLAVGAVRHQDHRFEWTRKEFQDWSECIAAEFGYNVRFLPIGNEDPELGSPTQMGVFTR